MGRGLRVAGQDEGVHADLVPLPDEPPPPDDDDREATWTPPPQWDAPHPAEVGEAPTGDDSTVSAEGPSSLRIFGIEDIHNLPRVEWLIDQVIQVGEGTLLYGDRGTGKSLVTLDQLLHIAAGLPWRGRPTKQGHVLLVCLENVYALPERIEEWKARHPAADLSRFHFTVERVQAIRDGDEARVHATIDQLPETPVLVALDTKQRFAAGLGENDGKDMQLVVDFLDRLRDKYRPCSTKLVDHSGKDATRGSRGHSSIEASHTVVIEVRKTDDGLVTARATKNNNGPDDWVEAWQIVSGVRGPALIPTEIGESATRKKMERVEQVVTIVAEQSGLTKVALRQAIGGNKENADKAIAEAVEDGRVVVVNGTRNAQHFYPHDRAPL